MWPSRTVQFLLYSSLGLAFAVYNDGDYEIKGSYKEHTPGTSNRQQRLFWGTTTTTTTTLSSTTACYTTSGSPSTACSKRRKRAIEANPFGNHDHQERILPASLSGSAVEEEVEPKQKITKRSAQPQSMRQSRILDLNQAMYGGSTAGSSRSNNGDARFLAFYWYTSTITSTKTSYTKTTTFTITGCTPAGTFSYAACG